VVGRAISAVIGSLRPGRIALAVIGSRSSARGGMQKTHYLLQILGHPSTGSTSARRSNELQGTEDRVRDARSASTWVSRTETPASRGPRTIDDTRETAGGRQDQRGRRARVDSRPGGSEPHWSSRRAPHGFLFVQARSSFLHADRTGLPPESPYREIPTVPQPLAEVHIRSRASSQSREGVTSKAWLTTATASTRSIPRRGDQSRLRRSRLGFPAALSPCTGRRQLLQLAPGSTAKTRSAARALRQAAHTGGRDFSTSGRAPHAAQWRSSTPIRPLRTH